MNNKFLRFVFLIPALFSCQEKYNKEPFDEKEKAIRNFPDNMDVLVLDSLWQKRDSLSYLRLKSVKIILIQNSDIIPNWISNFNTLKTLNIENEYKRKIKIIPSSLGKLDKLKKITFSDNIITTLPQSFFYLKSLQYLNLDNNKIKDIPKSLEGLKSIEAISLMNNPIHTIPNQVCKLSKLQSIVLENTKIKDLPKCLGHLTNLEWINVSGTQLTEFPIEILNAPKLETIDAKRLKLKNCKEVKAICKKKNIKFHYDER